MSNSTQTFKKRPRIQHPEGMRKRGVKKFQQILLFFIIALGFTLPTQLANAQSPVQSPVVITSTPATAAQEKQVYSTTIIATEANNDPLTFTAPVLPAWLTLSVGAGSAKEIGMGQWVYGVAVDDTSNVYFASSNSRMIYKVKPDGTKLEWHAFGPQSPSWTYGMIVHDGYLYISYYTSQCAGQTISRVLLSNPGAGEQIVLNSNTIGGGMGLAFRDGYMYFSAYLCNKIGRVNLTNLVAEDYIINALPNGYPWGLDFNANGDLYIGSQQSQGLAMYAKGTTSNRVMLLGTATAIDVKFDGQGYLYVGGVSGLRRYEPTLTSYEQIGGTGYVYAIGRNSNNMFAFSNVSSGAVYALQAGATLTGTPTHADLGYHPVKVSATNGTHTVDQEFIIHVTDPNPPLVKSFTPANLSIDIALDTILAAKFNEKIRKGNGFVYINRYDNDEQLGKIDINDQNIVITYDSISVRANGLPNNTHLYITVDPGAILDSTGNEFAGILSSGSWSFTTIAKTPQVITFSAKDTVIYGVEDYKPLASSNAGLPLGFTSSDESIASIVSGKIRVHKVGQVTIKASQDGDDNYLPANAASQTLTIKTKELTANVVPAPEIKRSYDGNTAASLNASNYELTGLVHGDVVTVSGTARYDDKNAGTEKKVYVADLALAGKFHTNYHLKATKDTTTGEITPKVIQVSLSATPAFVKVYDGTTDITADPSNYQLTGVVENDDLTISGVVAYDDKNAGEEKTLTGSMFELSGEDAINYQLTNNTATVTGTILKKEVTVTAHNKTKVYGAAEPVFTYDVSGLVEDEQLEGKLARTNNKNVGEHEIVVGSLSGGNNYTIADFAPATLSITPAALTIVADDKTKNQGQSNPAITFTYEGLTSGDVPADLTKMPQAQLSAVTGSPIGYYNIEVSGASSPNYTITYKNGKLTVVPAGNTHIKVWSSSASQLQIRVYSETAQKATLLLFTQNGQPVIREQKQLQAGVNSFTMQVGSLNAGVYLFNVKADKFDETQKVKIK